MNRTEKIEALSEQWGRCLIGHHKQRDTLHNLDAEFSFGELKYRVLHQAYVGENLSKSFHTKEAAENYLIDELINQIKDQANGSLKHIKAGEADPIEDGTAELWEDILLKVAAIKQAPLDDGADPVAERERLLDVEAKYKQLLQEATYAREQLDLLNVPVSSKEDGLDLPYSLGYRITLAVKQANKTT